MRFYVTYRGEFGASIDAKDEEEARRKFEVGECEIKPIGNLWQEYIEVEIEEEE